MREKDKELSQLRQQIAQIDAENLKYRQMGSKNEELLGENQSLREDKAQLLRENQLLNKYLRSIREQNLNTFGTFVPNPRSSGMIYDEEIIKRWNEKKDL